MTILQFYAFVGLPALLVVGSYVAVIMYERTSRFDFRVSTAMPPA